MNLVERPYVGLLFFVPGFTETLRVNGRAEISIDPKLRAPLAIKGKLPISVLKVTVEEAFLHCAKALIRARLWDSEDGTLMLSNLRAGIGRSDCRCECP